MSIKTLLAAGFVAVVAAGAAQANDAARFVLENSSGQFIDVIQVSPTSSNDWGSDLLGNRVLRPGGAVVVTPYAGGCAFDVRVTYHNGGKESFTNLNLCRTQRISFANTRNYVRY